MSGDLMQLLELQSVDWLVLMVVLLMVAVVVIEVFVGSCHCIAR